VPELHYLTLTEPSNPAQPRHLAYFEWGERTNTNVAVCLHGLSRNARDFDFLAKALASRYRVLCIDIAGRGRSDWFIKKSDYNYLVYLQDICALLGELKLTGVTVIGTSMGGIIGMMLAAQQKDSVSRLVLNDVGKTVSAAGLKRILGYVGTSAIFASKEEALDYLKTIIAPFGISSEAQWQHMFAASFNALPDGRYALAYDPDISRPFKEAAAKAEAVSDIDLSPIWNAVQCSVLILRGKNSDILAHETAVAMCERAAPTKLVEIEGVGHAPALLDKSQIEIITDWLDNTT
jgi:pimeloyl-ACP methyl ester carboxylesterase